MVRRWPGMRRGLLRLAIWPMILLKTCSPLPAEQQAPTSPGPSIGLPTLERLISLLGSSDLYSDSEIAEWLVSDLFPLEVEPAVRAAEAIKPVLVELAGVKAERDSYERTARTGRLVGLLGWVFGAACLGLTAWHFFLPNTLTVP
jgi:hypothetical protein